jgi:predicted RNA binding protein YcfA (HicA-like mRNA interferase family)
MTRLSAISRRELAQRLRQLGFAGPYTGGRHEFMIRGTVRITLPNPHRQDVGVDLLVRILRQAGITREEWLATE